MDASVKTLKGFFHVAGIGFVAGVLLTVLNTYLTIPLEQKAGL
jgi:predicted cobalt transporter CbtA